MKTTKGISLQAPDKLPSLGGVRQIAGAHAAAGLKFGIVVSRFNQLMTTELAKHAIACLKKHGADEQAITVIWVPGAYEIPAVLQRLASRREFAALLALGVVIQGETRHAELIDQQLTHSLADISRTFNIPVIYEVISAFSLEQAAARCGGGEKSRGWYAALAAMEMVSVFQQMDTTT